MKVALISPMYPSPANPVYGAFIQRQEESLSTMGVEFCHAVNTLHRPHEKTLEKYSELAGKVAALRSQKFDIVHVHYPNLAGVFAGLLAKARHVPLIATFHGGEVNRYTLNELSPLKRIFTQRSALWTARQAYASIAVGPEIVDALQAGGIGQDKIFMWDMGVDCKKCRPGSQQLARRHLNLPEDRPIAVFAGWLIPAKGPHYVLQAAHILKDIHPTCHWYLLGSGPLADELTEQIRALGLEDCVFLVGRRPWEEVIQWNIAADIHVMPTLTEAFGLSALEAMACGTPVIASAVGGLRSFIVNGENGFLVPPGDTADLAAKVTQLFSDPQLTLKFRAHGLETAHLHDINVQARKVYDLYCRAVESRHH
jgi:glycosyltransferase involved in cell wall biosynthesis